MVIAMKRFGDLIGVAAVIGVTGFVTIKLIEKINEVLQPANTAAQPQEWFEPQDMTEPAAPVGWRAIDPTEFALPDNVRDQVTVLKPGESLLPWLEEDHV